MLASKVKKIRKKLMMEMVMVKRRKVRKGNQGFIG